MVFRDGRDSLSAYIKGNAEQAVQDAAAWMLVPCFWASIVRVCGACLCARVCRSHRLSLFVK